jgi:hypothetical protein
MVIAMTIAGTRLRNKKILIGTIAYCTAAILVNSTLEKNPLVFPILNGGTIEILKDGYLETFSDQSGGYVKEPNQSKDFGKISYRKLSKGEKFNVTGIEIGHADFSTNVFLKTPIGRFDYVERDTESVAISQRMESPFVQKMGDLMNYPIFLLMLYEKFIHLIESK